MILLKRKGKKIIGTMKKNVLIINHDVDEAECIKKRLTSTVSEVICVTTMEDALKYFIKIEFCLVILDAHMSAADDHQFLKAMRNARTMPILVLSSQSDHEHRIHALNAGANAYMGKPYTTDECLAQAHSLMRLSENMHSDGNQFYTLVCGSDLIIDPAKRQVFLKGKELVFTKKEFDLLLCLASHPGRVFSREQLYDYVWDDKIVFNVDSVIKTHISSLRQKMIDAVVEYIKNVWGLGYKFNNEE